jgi:hypothetical protein
VRSRPPRSGARFFSVSVCYIGPLEDGERVLEPLRDFGKPVDRIAPLTYLQIQSANDSIFPRGRRYYWKAQFLGELTDDAIDTVLSAYAKAPAAASLLVLQHVGGAILVCLSLKRHTSTAMRSMIAFRFQSGMIRAMTKRTSDGRAIYGARCGRFR